MKKPKIVRKKHITYQADAEQVKRIEKLKKDLGIPTTAALFRKALAILELASDESKENGGIVSIKAKGASQSSGISIALRI